ncbi:uncharacterized protein LOC121727854 isoform X3 [Aricia agestis]|uniref:uncharacterized protein LOC121727854 isoform X3 n=1 Tax=Aricia agestis TaxID=91739 RepID=UPI001C20944A|nr:uncharacterized protein LOC121727854 isoform X3 [Aricia agestis]
MGNKKKLFIAKKRKRKNEENLEKARASKRQYKIKSTEETITEKDECENQHAEKNPIMGLSETVELSSVVITEKDEYENQREEKNPILGLSETVELPSLVMEAAIPTEINMVFEGRRIIDFQFRDSYM